MATPNYIKCAYCNKQQSQCVSNLSFHRFPENEEKRNEWLKILGLSEVSKHARLCSNHFAPESFHDFYKNVKKRRLTRHAKPRITRENCQVGPMQDNCPISPRRAIETNENCSKSIISDHRIILSPKRKFGDTISVHGRNEISDQEENGHLQNNSNILPSKSPAKENGSTPTTSLCISKLEKCKLNIFKDGETQNFVFQSETIEANEPDIEGIKPLEKSNLTNATLESSSKCNKNTYDDVQNTASEALVSDGKISKNATIVKSQNDHFEEVSKETITAANIESNDKKVTNTSKRRLTMEDYVQHGKKVCKDHEIANANPPQTESMKTTRKRQLNMDNYMNPPKIRIMTGTTSPTLTFTRLSFSSDEEWCKFVKARAYWRSSNSNLRVQLLRSKERNKSLKDMIKRLQEDKDEAATQFLKDLPPHVKQLIMRMKEKSMSKAFPPDLKIFARTLHFYSPAAYNFFRTSFLKVLPNVETLNKWIADKKLDPGTCDDTIDYVGQIVNEQAQKGKKLFFNITFDEMNIGSHLYWDKQKKTWGGLVDCGGLITRLDKNGNVPKATKALVFMLVNINGSFSVPVAHYLIDSLTGEQKAILLEDLLKKLESRKINVTSVTFDGDRTHFKACEVLGANFNYGTNEFKPFFIHPSNKNKIIYVILDACHMLKLVRKYIFKHQLIFNETNYIYWSFIRKLHERQTAIGLHFANKLTERHVNFNSEKMRVFLAAQVLSSSVAKALNFLEFQQNDIDFVNSSATAEFCQTFNDIFDTLNISSKFSKTPLRRAINKDSLNDLKERIVKYTDYIEKLEAIVTTKKKGKKSNAEKNILENQMHAHKSTARKDTSKSKKEEAVMKIERKKVLQHEATKTGFLGFIISLKNTYSICCDLLLNDSLSFILTYKFSQDHVEMFFAMVRQKNGFNDNPTVQQYLSAFKKLSLQEMNVTIPRSANCTPRDKTFLLTEDATGKTTNKAKEDKESTSGRIEECTLNDAKDIKDKVNRLKKNLELFNAISNQSMVDHDYFGYEPWSENEQRRFSGTIDEIVTNVAGVVVRYLNKSLCCKYCKSVVVDGQKTSDFKLINIKDRGDINKPLLNRPSDDLVFVCRQVERKIRQHRNVLLTKDIYIKLLVEVAKVIPHEILDKSDHILDQEPLRDHRHQLLLLIIQIYLDIRLKHYGKLLKSSDRVRTRNHKVIHFKGQ